MRTVFKLSASGKDDKILEFEPYCSNGIRVSIKQGENEMFADVRLEELEEAVEETKNYCAKRKERADAAFKRHRERKGDTENDRPKNT